MRGSPKPLTIDGVDYVSKTAAIMTFSALGMPQREIAIKVGCTINSVGSVVSAKKKAAAKASGAPETMPGLWTPEKRDKVRRLFGQTMILIADAVQVPPAELLTYVLHGAIPPSQAIKDPGDIRWTGEQQQLPAPPADDEPDAQILPREAFEASDTDPDIVEADDLVVEPDRDEDEAELARLAALEEPEVAPPAPARFPAADPGPVAEPPVGAWLYRLKNEMGEYLHKSGKGMTRALPSAWTGTSQQLEEILKRHPHLKELDEQRCK